ncbi:hypothetical protein PILCRDRAFT_827819 [Piloderma croceum F 1598]|uniref:SPX domain-containing protein n=1 Tax=Piloderma croceum (strain F 1598) TaxID=765440 RepID=A0A0C3EQM2_PILCF|nr:hypothetical protein PILCRDRAFT_827819 [Piloderma croceum F 1598]
MKFSSSLRFNAVSEWWEEYIAYDALKKYIYQLEKQQHDLGRSSHDLEANERETLIQQATRTATDSVFVPLLDRELKKIVFFYESQEKELLDAVTNLEELVKDQEEAGLAAEHQYLVEGEEDDDDDDDDDEPASPSLSREESGPPKRRRRRSSATPHYVTGNTIPEERPIRHRYSISSSDDSAADLEASVASIRQAPIIHGATLPRAGSSSKSPLGKARSIANKLNFMRDSSISQNDENIWTAKTDFAWDIRILFKRRITALYIQLTSLKSYVEINYSGFRKILKKYDKVTYSELKNHYLHEVVEDALPFRRSSKDKVNDGIQRLQTLYAKCITHEDKALARQQLKLHQREHIAWERDTVWRQMIGRERRGEGDGDIKAIGATLVTEEDGSLLHVATPVGHFNLTRKKIFLVFAIAVFVILLEMPMLDEVEANRCFAILIFSTIMWATEAIPLFVTSLLVPLLLVVLRVIRSQDGDTRLSSQDATKFIFSVMFSPTIMLLIGGFTIASALSKTNIDRVLITRVLSLAGTRPNSVLLAFMAVSCFASMWISNVAAPTLCFTLIRPILRTLPPKSSFGPALIIAIALAANIGGQSSPISSPQNLIALQAMEPPLDWGSWFAVALPVSAISIVIIWLLLLASYRPARSPDGEGDIEIKTIRPTKDPFTLKQYWVSFVCLGTIALWCVEHTIQEYVGDMGIIAIIPIIAFFSTGVLKKDDFEQFAWTIVFLAMGGIALGKGVTNSGLLETMDTVIRRLLDGFSLYTVVLILSPVVLVISTFISHTIASVLLVPIAKEVGSNLPGNHANLLIFITGLICSTGMGMPVSGFPNQTAATQEDELGQLYLSNMDFFKNGVPASIIATLVVVTVGFLLMKAIGL